MSLPKNMRDMWALRRMNDFMINSNYPTHAYLMTYEQWQQYKENIIEEEPPVPDIVVIPPSPEPVYQWPNGSFGD